MVDFSRAFIPDTSLTGTLGQFFKGQEIGQAFQDKREAKQAGKLLAVDREDALNLFETGVETGEEDKITRGLGRISTLFGPKASAEFRAILDRGDKAELAQNQADADEAFRFNTFLKDVPMGQQIRFIREEGERRAAQGKPIDKLQNLANLNDVERGIEIDRRILGSRDISDISKEATNRAEFAREQAARPPLTDIGDARDDLKRGLITQKDFKTIQNTPEKFQSSVGKLLGDKAKAIEVFGNNSPQAKAVQEAIDSEKKGEGPKLNEVAGIRKEFSKLSGDFIKLRDAIGKVRANATDPSAAGDLSLIFNFMKILDPGSVVRESEFATAANTAGVPDRIRNQYNRVLRGERLAVNQRKDFVDTANELFDAQESKQVQLEESFRGIAERAGVENPEDVVIDFKVTPKGGGDGKDLSKVSTDDLLKRFGQ